MLALTIAGVGLALAARIDMTLEDFHVPGTQVGQVSVFNILTSSNCAMCHGNYDFEDEPHATWAGSLMAHGGRDPLFLAQMATANQDVGNVGYFCMRCHVPMSIVTGHANQTDGSTLDAVDMDGVNCHFCHAMVDPIYVPGESPAEDAAVLAGLAEVPQYYGNAMFVLDPSGLRRGPIWEPASPHDAIRSDFFQRSDMCGTCHDVGNVAVTRQPNGSYRYNTIDQRTPNTDPWTQFPLERTYTEWRLSAFAAGGVDMGGRFGGEGPPVVSTCQDCHMPKTTARTCFFGPERSGMGRHDFAGAAAPSLDLIALHYQNDPAVDPAAIARGRQKAVEMLERAASLEVAQEGRRLRVRVINESGHKLPTGHIEGRRVWLNVKFYDAAGALIGEFGHYDAAEAQLDEASTKIYEMIVGLSPEAAQLTELPPGPTTHMALADTIVKDNRIPPRGFNNAAFEAGGAPVVDYAYTDGQYWDDTHFAIPPGAARSVATVNYQSLTRHYVEALRDGNTTNHWGQTLYNLWVQTGKGAPIRMTDADVALHAFPAGDLNCDGGVNFFDIDPFVLVLFDRAAYESLYPACDPHLADMDLSGSGDFFDIDPFLDALFGG